MDKKLLELLLPIVNDASVMDALLAYANWRSARVQSVLETSENMHLIAQTQGRMAELKELLKLRDVVNAKSKEHR
jgi:hypothetical protein